MVGQLATVGILPNLKRLFYYSAEQSLLIEIIDRRQRDTKHFVKLVDGDGNDVALPAGCRFKPEKKTREEVKTPRSKKTVS